MAAAAVLSAGLTVLHVTDDPDEVCDIVTRGHAAQLAILESRHGPMTR